MIRGYYNVRTCVKDLSIQKVESHCSRGFVTYGLSLSHQILFYSHWLPFIHQHVPEGK